MNTQPSVPGIVVEEMDAMDSFFTMLTHFGAVEQDTQPMPLLDVPDWGFNDFQTQRDQDIRKLSK